MAITAALVRELREETGSGMMDCKKALVATNGDKEAAIEWLRKKGLATAEKKSGRIASEGLSMIVLSEDAKKGVAVEVNSETDFVAQNEKFRNYVKTVADQALDTKAADIDAFLAETSKADPTKTVAEYNASMIAVIGENLKIRRFQQLEEQNGFVTGYTHMNGKIVVLTEQTKNDPKMAGKPEKVISGAVMGRLKKELKEICLLDQEYVKAEDGKQSVAQYVASVAKAQNAKINIKGFVRFETGEGLEKKNEDFAAEAAPEVITAL